MNQAITNCTTVPNTTEKIDGIGFTSLNGIDTTFVLFFLALEYGRAVEVFSIDGMLMGITMLMVLALPYFLPSKFDKPLFSHWIIGRMVIAVFGIGLGIVLQQGLGTLFPASLRFVPMTLLIVSAMISCYIQFYGLLKLRLAK